MSCALTEEELWSGLDRNAPEVLDHLDSCPTCQARAAELRAGINLFSGDRPPAAVKRNIPQGIGPYRIIRFLAEGGMGIVYEGEQKSPKRDVAIKVIRGGACADGAMVKLFQREAETLARLKHPGIAAIYEAGLTDEGEHFFAMELVAGEPLNVFVRENGLSLRERLQLFLRICDAINYAHQRGVIHRDLKPSNILVDRDGKVKVLDFGVARLTDSEVTLTGTSLERERFMGTLPYMSPEAVRGDPDDIDVRSDIYSLGVLFFELVSDELPYTVSRANMHAAERIICEEQPRRPGLIHRGLRGDIETIALKALEKDPARRYQGVGAFADDINRHLSNQPIMARPPSLTYQLGKLIRRHKRACVYAAASLAIALSVVAWVRYYMADLQVSTQARDDMSDMLLAVEVSGAADALLRNGDYEQAEPRYRRALPILARVSGSARARYTADAQTGLASLLIERGDINGLAEAEALLDEADAYCRQPQASSLPENVPRVQIIQALRALMRAQSLQHQSAYDEAEKQYELALASLPAGHRSYDRYRARTLLGRAALEVERDEPSARRKTGDMLASTLAIYDDDLPRGHELEVEFIRGLQALNNAKLAEQQGDLSGCEEFYRTARRRFEALQATFSHRFDVSRYMLHASLGLGRALLARNDPGLYGEVERLLVGDDATDGVGALQLCNSRLPAGHPLYKSTLESLRIFYGPDHINDPEELAILIEEGMVEVQPAPSR